MPVDFDKGMRPNLYEIMQEGGGTYELPPATTETLGGVIIGRGIDLEEDGTISVTAPAPVDTYTKEEIDEQQEAQDYNINSNTLAIERLETAVGNTYTKAEIDTQQQAQDTNISANASAIATAQNDIDAIEAHQTVQDTNINVNATAILSATSDISAIQAQQQTQDDNIAANATSIRSLQNTVNNFYTKAEIDAQQQAQDTSINANAAAVANVVPRVTTIEGQQVVQDADIAANTSAITNLQNAITNFYTKAEINAQQQAQDTNIGANASAISELATTVADDNTLGLIKTDSAKFIETDENGVLQIGGRLGQFPGGGVYYPETIEPTNVSSSSFLMTDGAKNISVGQRTFGIMAGANLTCKSAAAGATQYRLTNNLNNRFACFAGKNGRLAIDQTDAINNGTAAITDISFANGTPISAYFGAAESDNDIIITTDRSVNPNTATNKLRIYGTSTSSDVINVGQGCGAGGGKAISLGQSCFAGGNQSIAFGNSSIVTANNSVAFGHTNLVSKQFCFAAGQGHDFTNASNGTGAVGICSELSTNTLFAVGNGTYATSGNITRSNALEVLRDGIVLKSPNNTKFKISVDDNGNLVTTQL